MVGRFKRRLCFIITGAAASGRQNTVRGANTLNNLIFIEWNSSSRHFFSVMNRSGFASLILLIVRVASTRRHENNVRLPVLPERLISNSVTPWPTRPPINTLVTFKAEVMKKQSETKEKQDGASHSTLWSSSAGNYGCLIGAAADLLVYVEEEVIFFFRRTRAECEASR